MNTQSSSLLWERQLNVTPYSRRITVDAWHESPCPAFTQTLEIAPHQNVPHGTRSKVAEQLQQGKTCWPCDTVTSFELLARAAGGPRGNISVAVRYILPLHVRNVAIKAVWPWTDRSLRKSFDICTYIYIFLFFSINSFFELVGEQALACFKPCIRTHLAGQ